MSEGEEKTPPEMIYPALDEAGDPYVRIELDGLAESAVYIGFPPARG